MPRASARALPGATWVLALLLGSCGVAPPPGPPATLRLGGGASSFTAIEDGDTLLLVRGCQGAQHVWITLRAGDIDPRGVLVELALTRASDGVMVSAELFIRLSFTPSGEDGTADLSGLTLVVPDPTQALERDLVLSANIVDRDGRVASATRDVRVAWGTEVCGT